MRRQPVAFALIDSAFLADSKWRKLRTRLPDPRDFNSAVGAYLIALTAARRNGLPEIDVAEEVEDATFLPDLVAVGLLTPNGLPEKPFREWAPRRPSYPSDLAPSAPNAPSAPTTPARKSSTPLPSYPLNSTNGEVRPLASDGLTLDDDAIHGLEDRTGRPASVAGFKQLSEYDRLVQDHGLQAVLDTFDRIREGKTMTARQLVWPAVKLLEPFPDVRVDPSEAVAEVQNTRNRRVAEEVWRRREEAYRWTGHWEEEWGDPPAERTVQ